MGDFVKSLTGLPGGSTNYGDACRDLQLSKTKRVEKALERHVKDLVKEKGDQSLNLLFARDRKKTGAMAEVSTLEKDITSSLNSFELHQPFGGR